jgi:tryptophan synthase beta subunit
MIVRDVINYCISHYEESGFDIVVETLTDTEIEAIIEGTHTLEDAISAVLSWVTPIHEYREEMRSTEW